MERTKPGNHAQQNLSMIFTITSKHKLTFYYINLKLLTITSKLFEFGACLLHQDINESPVLSLSLFFGQERLEINSVLIRYSRVGQDGQSVRRTALDIFIVRWRHLTGNVGLVFCLADQR